MIAKTIFFFNAPVLLACDANCTKAWGINNRPRVEFGDEDDVAYYADHELGDAPADPGTYEGPHGKPTAPEQRLNKWCARECERSVLIDLGKLVTDATLPSFTQRSYNQPWKHGEPNV